MNDPAESSLQALLGAPDDAPIILTRLSVLDWGGTLIFAGTAGDQTFELRYTDCRELRWRVYVHEQADATPLVSFSPGRDGQRSPAQFLTGQFGLSLFYGCMTYSSRVSSGDEC